MAKFDSAPPGVVLLSAGRGSRMLPLTEGIPKSLLPVGDRLVLDWLIEAVIARTSGEIVVVTGYGGEKVVTHLRERFGSRISTVENERYAEDVNILSVETGVSALRHPERGYLIVETDLLLDDSAWDQVFEAARRFPELSCWVCDGFYGPCLTGGIVHADRQGRIDAVEYQPLYSPDFDGWPKMVGLLLVGVQQVAADRRLRQAAIAQSIDRTENAAGVEAFLDGLSRRPFDGMQKRKAAIEHFFVGFDGHVGQRVADHIKAALGV